MSHLYPPFQFCGGNWEADQYADSRPEADRDNEGKPQYSLLSLEALEPCVRVLEYGCKKYARANWKKGQKMSSLMDSTIRHLSKILEGELVDEESGLSHLGHAMCNLMFAAHSSTIQDINKVDQSVEDNK